MRRRRKAKPPKQQAPDIESLDLNVPAGLVPWERTQHIDIALEPRAMALTGLQRKFLASLFEFSSI
jgi:hypothetical protein